ncbi:MAG: carboxypeptidase-like regulatory domain-containing protein [Planctomycetia bacterium]
MNRCVNLKLSVMILACCTLFLGCGEEKLNRPPVFKVKGKVTLQGKPVPNADVTFIHKESNRAAFGKTNAEGEYKLTTFNANDGAVEGKHDISVVDIPPVPSTPAISSVESADYQPPKIGEDTMPKPKSRLPQRYADAATSGLFGVVNPDGENVVDLELTP